MIDDARCRQAAMARTLEAATVVASSFCGGENRGEEEIGVPDCSTGRRSDGVGEDGRPAAAAAMVWVAEEGWRGWRVRG